MKSIKEVLKTIDAYLKYPLLELGTFEFTLWLLIYIAVGLFLLFFLTARFKHFLINHVLIRYTKEIGIRQAIGGIVKYVLIFFGLLIILQTAGIDLSTLTVLAGALGIGIGFGLQNITNNFISGIIILFERPIKVGDRIEIGETHGQITDISARATTITTNDNVSIIVPNSEFMQSKVINWSHNDYKVRFRIPVSVAYGSDVEQVSRLLLELAKEDPHVLNDPKPSLRLKEFGDNGIHFELLVWTDEYIHRRGKFISDINFRIIKKFTKHGIQIPFPQRDIYIKEHPAGQKPAVV
ncbi:MAG: mechanosensitive ion channel [Bacteroidales bacterium]|nr:mechanosensitive ion channel [Bacteroidales bacterium]